MCFLLHVFLTEENKAENDSFEADLIAGRLQEEVVRLKRFPKSHWFSLVPCRNPRRHKLMFCQMCCFRVEFELFF